jgi:hypothetical protein
MHFLQLIGYPDIVVVVSSHIAKVEELSPVPLQRKAGYRT